MLIIPLAARPPGRPHPRSPGAGRRSGGGGRHGQVGAAREIAGRVDAPVHFRCGGSGPSAAGERVVWDIPPASTPEPLPEPSPPETAASSSPSAAKPICRVSRGRLPMAAPIIAPSDLMFGEAEIAAHFGPIDAGASCATPADGRCWSALRRAPAERRGDAAFLEAELLAPLPPPGWSTWRPCCRRRDAVGRRALLPFVRRDPQGSCIRRRGDPSSRCRPRSKRCWRSASPFRPKPRRSPKPIRRAGR